MLNLILAQMRVTGLDTPLLIPIKQYKSWEMTVVYGILLLAFVFKLVN